MSMPRRPRQHVVEEASRARLRSALPLEWAISDTTHDYGLDARVDLFRGGMASGLAFWVQLKSTDEPDLSRALKVSFEVSALNFMSAQADPALLLLHHGPTDRLFAQWLHRARIVLRKPDQKTVTVKWAEEHELGTDPSAALRWEAQRFRKIRQAGIGGIGARLQIDAAPAEATAIRLAISRLFRRVGGHMSLTDVEDPDVTIRLSADVLEVDMSVSSLNVDMADGGGLADPVPNIAAACAHCFESLGRSDLATALVLAEPHASLLQDEPIALHLAPAFVAAGRLADAATLLVRYAESGSGPRMFETALLMSLGANASEIDLEGEVVGSDLLRVAGALEAADRGDDAAAAFYNAGNFLFSVANDPTRARTALTRAGELRTDYLGRAYFLAELAATHFETGSYESAEDLYRRSLDLASIFHPVVRDLVGRVWPPVVGDGGMWV